MPEFVQIDGLKRYFDVSRALAACACSSARPRQIVQAVDGVDFAIAKGETFSLVGESGCGKSTVARLVVGLYPPTARHDRVRRQRHGDRPQPVRTGLRRRMQMIFQDPYASLNPRWRVRDIIAEPIRAFGLAKDKADLRKRVGDLLRQVRLTPADGEQISRTSSRGGQRQRISIARALASRAGIPGVRRADLGARRLGAGADPEPDEGPAAALQPHLSVHLPQSRGRPPHLDARRRDVSRPARRAGADRDAVPAARRIPTRGCCSTRSPTST